MASLDVFRGVNLLLMMFANFLGDRNLYVADLPAWMRHASQPDSLTFPDVIWPAFTFMLGLSLPLAVERRLAAGQTALQIWRHLVARALALMVMGCLLGNAWMSAGSGQPIGLSMPAWNILLIVSFLMIWRHEPGQTPARRRLAVGLRLAGIALLLALGLLFRDGPEQKPLRLCWWILGALGWAYLVSGSVYLLFRRQPAALMGCLGLCILVYVGDKSGAFDRFAALQPIRERVPFGSLLGVHPAMALVGLIVGLLWVAGSPVTSPWARLRWMLIFAVGVFGAGFLLQPLYGCWKGAETPTWALYSTAIGCLILAGLHAVVDVWKRDRWTALVRPAGSNPLLVYLLADLTYPLLLVLGLDSSAAGLAGVVRSTVLAFGLMLLTHGTTTRRWVVLKL